ncbi:MAG TPA: hypothetical protein VEN81_15415 [Planctomycetota bacterium]|jgi:hypothetical protein|nr:hypothetical protein [Planctomycetota bacterium]
MSQSRKVAGGCCVVFGVLCLAGLGALWAFQGRSPGDREATVGLSWVLGILAGLLALGAWRFLRPPFGRRTAFQWDLLRQGLSFQALPEKDGLQWSMLVFPDSIQPPGVSVLAFLVQNCTSSSREVRLKLSGLNPPAGEGEHRFILMGGQAGVYRIPLRFHDGMTPGPRPIDFTVEAKALEKKGLRVIEHPGAAVRTLPQARQVTIEILSGTPGAAVNEFAAGWAGFQPIFETGRSAPDLEPLRLLEELRSTPERP